MNYIGIRLTILWYQQVEDFSNNSKNVASGSFAGKSAKMEKQNQLPNTILNIYPPISRRMLRIILKS